jgi:hypothetical protein
MEMKGGWWRGQEKKTVRKFRWDQLQSLYDGGLPNIHEEMSKCFTIYEEAFIHSYDFATDPF